jgi:hypothetical protein
MTGAFSVSLSLLRVGILGCVKKGAAPLVRQLVGELAGAFFSPILLGLMGCLVQAEALKWCHQKFDL